MDAVTDSCDRIGIYLLQSHRVTGDDPPVRKVCRVVFDGSLIEHVRASDLLSRIAEHCLSHGLSDYVLRDVDVPDREVREFFADGKGRAIYASTYIPPKYGSVSWAAEELGMSEDMLRHVSNIAAGQTGDKLDQPESAACADDASEKKPSEAACALHPADSLADWLETMGYSGKIVKRLRLAAFRSMLRRSQKAIKISKYIFGQPKIPKLLGPARKDKSRKKNPREAVKEKKVIEQKSAPVRPQGITFSKPESPAPTLSAYESYIFATSSATSWLHGDLGGFVCLADGAGSCELSKVDDLRERKAVLKQLNSHFKAAGLSIRGKVSGYECLTVTLQRGRESDSVHWLCGELQDWANENARPAAFSTHFKESDESGCKLDPHAHVIYALPEKDAQTLSCRLVENAARWEPK